MVKKTKNEQTTVNQDVCQDENTQATTENATQLNDFFQAEGRQEQAHLYSITDSFGQEGKQYPRSCCHVKGFRKVMEFDENGNEEPALLPVSSKTRMYLFDTATEGAWWEHLVDMLSR